MRITTIVLGLILVVFIGRFFYKVACISCTPPSIKKYKYSGEIAQFESKIKTFAKLNPDMNLKISYRDSSDKSNTTARDMIIELKNDSANVLYNISYIQRKSDEFTSVYLDELHDEIHKSGGNDLDSTNVKILFNGFTNKFLQRLNRANIILKPQSFYLY